MKKNILSLKTLLFIFATTLSVNMLYATVHIVQVGTPTNQFTPSSMTVSLGDTVRFQYVTGFHTTTSTAVPAGATSWDVPMQTPGAVYDYVPAVEGEYDYWCVIHGLAMTGTFTVSAPTSSTLHTILVGSPTNSFTPSSITVNLGDTIRFQYVAGFHTTTSTAVPTGASSWDVPMQTPGATFDYVPSTEGDYNYWCTIHGLAMTGAFTVSTPLAIRMGLLQGKFTNDNNVNLNWETYEEHNNSYFEIQKSPDGLKFTTIYSLPSKAEDGNSTNILAYSYSDTTPVHDRVFYRLQQIDNDGKSSYSNVVYLAVKGDKDIIVKIHPNPAKTNVMVHIQGNIPEGAEIQLTDMNGKTLDKLPVSANDMSMPMLDISKLPAGMYLVKYVDKNQVITQKLTKD